MKEVRRYTHKVLGTRTQEQFDSFYPTQEAKEFALNNGWTEVLTDDDKSFVETMIHNINKADSVNIQIILESCRTFFEQERGDYELRHIASLIAKKTAYTFVVLVYGDVWDVCHSLEGVRRAFVQFHDVIVEVYHAGNYIESFAEVDFERIKKKIS